MKPLIYAPAATNDLGEIAAYIAVDDRQRALSFVAELKSKAATVVARPTSYRERSELSPGLRAVSHGPYLIFFRDLPDQVRVVRVVHGARDLPTIFKS